MRTGHEWNPRQPRFTAHRKWARSAMTRARDVVPLGVLTMVVVSQSGAFVADPLLEERRAAGAVGEALHEDGAVAHGLHQRRFDGDVVVDEVELRVACGRRRRPCRGW